MSNPFSGYFSFIWVKHANFEKNNKLVGLLCRHLVITFSFITAPWTFVPIQINSITKLNQLICDLIGRGGG